jgi:hypothetical protein
MANQVSSRRSLVTGRKSQVSGLQVCRFQVSGFRLRVAWFPVGRLSMRMSRVLPGNFQLDRRIFTMLPFAFLRRRRHGNNSLGWCAAARRVTPGICGARLNQPRQGRQNNIPLHPMVPDTMTIGASCDKVFSLVWRINHD